MAKRFEGRGSAARTAYIGSGVTINGTVGHGAFFGDGVTVDGAFIGDGVTVDGYAACMAAVHDGAMIEANASVNGYATVRERTIIKEGVTVPMGACIHLGYIVHAILSAGFDSRGYHVIAVLCQQRNDDGSSNPLHWRIMAGCRNFDFEDALRHWGRPDWAGGSPDILAKVAYLKKAVKIWEKKHGKLGCRL